jgi:hypothetical protein
MKKVMKKLLIGLFSAFLCLSAMSQTVTLSFRGNTQNRDYRVMIDGTNYYSTNATNSNNDNVVGNARMITISNLSPGSHTISVYNNNSANATSQRLYTNTFQLRSEYDMNIAITGNRVAFSEKLADIADGNTSSLGASAMASADFAQLLQEIRGSRYQSSRAATIREAVSSADHFTANQVRQMLALVTSETTRLELAKLAYPVVTDQENYATRLNTVITTRANRNDLGTYIQTQVNTGTTLPPTTGTSRALLSTYQYDQLLQNLNSNNYQSGKFTLIKNAFANTGSAFTTAQIRQLLGVITSEPDRLYLAKQAYITAYDPANFYTLLTLFASQSNRAELNSYIVSNGGTGGSVYVQTRIPMSDANFDVLLKNAGNHILASSKVKEVRTAFTDPQNNFTSAQARQLLTVVTTGNILTSVSEATRLELAKLSYARVTDPENFYQIIDLFTNQASRDELNSYIKVQVQNNY